MLQKTYSSSYICMIRLKEQIYPSARVINPPPLLSRWDKKLNVSIEHCKLLRQMVSVTPQFVYHRSALIYRLDAASGESS